MSKKQNKRCTSNGTLEEKCQCGFHTATITHTLLQLDEEIKKIGHGIPPKFDIMETHFALTLDSLEKLPELCGIEVTDLTRMLQSQVKQLDKLKETRKEAGFGEFSEFELAESIQQSLGKVWINLMRKLKECGYPEPTKIRTKEKRAT